MAITAYIKIFS